MGNTSVTDINMRLMQIPGEMKTALAAQAVAKTAFITHDNQKKIQQAVYELKHSEDKRSQAEIARRAQADPNFKEFMAKSTKAEIDFITTTSEVEALKVELSALQTASKNIVAEISLGGYSS